MLWQVFHGVQQRDSPRSVYRKDKRCQYSSVEVDWW